MCEELGCAPSELLTKHPNLTHRDKWFLIQYGFEKRKRNMEDISKLFGGKK